MTVVVRYRPGYRPFYQTERFELPAQVKEGKILRWLHRPLGAQRG
jgi:hypothetical protein